ncbi:MAG: thermonuclease family protein [Patescibacteria group bacterium]
MDTLLTIARDVLLELLMLLQLFVPGQALPMPSQESDVAQSAIASTTLYSVVKVVDGDTVHIDMDGKKETVRLIGMNTPETVDPRRPVECFGKEASAKAKELLDGQQVRIETEVSQGERDKYGRLLGYVIREDGLLFNKYMIEEGYAYEYTYRLPYKYQAEFKAAQKEAEAAGRGLWAPGVCER